MHAFVLQDWITIRGNGTATVGTTVVQDQTDWLDLGPYQDLFFWVACSEVTGTTVSLYFETSPTDDEALFQSLFGGVVPSSEVAAISTMTASPSPTIVKVPMLSAVIPLARYLRWKLIGPTGATWDVTMRILVAANSPGM